MRMRHNEVLWWAQVLPAAAAATAQPNTGYMQDRADELRKIYPPKLSDEQPEGVSYARFGGAERRLGACSASMGRSWGPALGHVSIFQTVSPRARVHKGKKEGPSRSSPTRWLNRPALCSQAHACAA